MGGAGDIPTGKVAVIEADRAVFQAVQHGHVVGQVQQPDGRDGQRFAAAPVGFQRIAVLTRAVDVRPAAHRRLAGLVRDGARLENGEGQAGRRVRVGGGKGEDHRVFPAGLGGDDVADQILIIGGALGQLEGGCHVGGRHLGAVGKQRALPDNGRPVGRVPGRNGGSGRHLRGE